MINVVLDKLDRLKSELCAIDPQHELRAADLVADMALRLRDTLKGNQVNDGELSRRLTQLRRLDKVAV